MKDKIIKDKHTFECWACFEMKRRGYTKEKKFWDDYFRRKLKPIKFRLLFNGKLIKLKDIKYE